MDDRDQQVIQLMGTALKDPAAAESGVKYTNTEYGYLPPGEKSSPSANPKDYYGGNPKEYIAKMLAYGAPTPSKGEHVVEEFNSIFGSGSHAAVNAALSKMTPDQQLAFAQFLSKFGQVEDPLRKRDFGTKVREAVTAPNVVSRAFNRAVR